MILFVVFCLAAAIVGLAPRFWAVREKTGGYHLEGLAFMAAIMVPWACGRLLNHYYSATLVSGHWTRNLMCATCFLYAVSVSRGAWRMSRAVVDLSIVLAACAVIELGQPAIHNFVVPFSHAQVNLGEWSFFITVAWVWLLTRTTAALNRTPQVTGGYLGVVGLTFLLVSKLGSGTVPLGHFPSVVSAAMAGAGLASVPIAFHHKGFNVGWSASLACGFLLAQISVSGPLQGLGFTIVALLLLVFGLPLLDVFFYRLRVSHDGNAAVGALRWHEVLGRRGISGPKVAAIYLALAAALCLLGLLLIATTTWNKELRVLFLAALLFVGYLFFFSIVRVLMRRGPDEEIPATINTFGMKITPVSMREAIQRIDEMIQSRRPHHVLTCDANAILRAQEDEEYAAIARRAAMITPDGYGVMWGARLLNLPVYERVTGIDMVEGACEIAARKGYSIYILGSEPGIAATAAAKLQARHPGLKVAGTQHGFYAREGISEETVVQAIRDARPDVLFVAFGIPSQEKFIARNFEAMQVPVSMGVGGSFDVYSEKLTRAPLYIQRAGLEWVYRVWIEPWRWKRMGYVPRFMLLAIKVWLFGEGKPRHRVGAVTDHVAP